MCIYMFDILTTCNRHRTRDYPYYSSIGHLFLIHLP